MNTSRCAKCGGQMQPGFVLDRGHSGYKYAAPWVAGSPQEGFWGVKDNGREQYPIQSLRCSNCGYLEFYA